MIALLFVGEVRQVVAEYSLEQKCDFVLKHAAEPLGKLCASISAKRYLQTTGREGNWAGSHSLRTWEGLSLDG